MDLAREEKDAFLYMLGEDHDDLVRLMAAKKVVWILTFVKDYKVVHDHAEEFEEESFRLLSDPDPLVVFPGQPTKANCSSSA